MSDFKPRPRREQTPEERMKGGHGLEPRNPDPHACMYVFIDLTCVSIDYSIVEFLVLAIEEAKQSGLEQLHVVFVPAANDSFCIHGTPARLSDEWRIQNILMQAPWLCPMCVGITWCTTREQADLLVRAVGPHVIPHGYDVSQGSSGFVSANASHEVIKKHGGRDFRHLRSTESSKSYVQRWLDRYVGKKRPIVITLRETVFDAERNSDVAEWVAFARSLDPDVYCPVFVRDTDTLFGGEHVMRDNDSDFVRRHEQALADLGEFLSLPEAAMNLHARSALYELSYANLMVATGPTALCVYNRAVRYLSFRPVVGSAHSTSEAYLNWIGMERGKSFPFGGPTQKLVWEDDTFDVISREFKLLVENLTKV